MDTILTALILHLTSAPAALRTAAHQSVTACLRRRTLRPDLAVHVIAPSIAHLSHPAVEVRAAAHHTLTAIAEEGRGLDQLPHAVGPALSNLTHPHQDVRAAAAHMLLAFVHHKITLEVAPLLAVFPCSVALLKALAREGMGTQALAAAIPALGQHLAPDKPYNSRCACDLLYTLAACHIGLDVLPQILPAVIDSLRSEDDAVRWHAHTLLTLCVQRGIRDADVLARGVLPSIQQVADPHGDVC
jgi:hypothetical protein